jgi:hypothetical protein
MTKIESLEDFVRGTKSCPIEVNKGMRGGIRIRQDSVGFEIDVRHANGDVEYQYCAK